jgi:hypothetical protein
MNSAGTSIFFRSSVKSVSENCSDLYGTVRDLNKKSADLTGALEEGSDVKPVLNQLRRRTGDRAALQAPLAAPAGRTTLSPKQFEAFLADLGGMTGLLKRAIPDERPSIYAELGIRLVYGDRTNRVRATREFSRVANRVGGGLGQLLHSL